MRYFALSLVAPTALSACLEAAPSGPANVPGYTETPWSAVPALVESCQVTEVQQGHDRSVVLIMRDGTEIYSRSPALDDILHLLGEYGCPGEVAIIME